MPRPHGGARSRSILLLTALSALSALFVGACRQDMHDQPKFQPLEESFFFDNGAASRPLVEGTVARGHLGEDVAFETGLAADGSFAAEIPMPVDLALLGRGRTRFEAFCAPCHDRVGSGRGMIVRRGYKQPNSFHEQRLLETQPGYFVNVMTNGFGQMSSYAAQIRPADRWAIAAYIQALQLSQRVPEAALSESDRRSLAGETTADSAAEPALEPADGHAADGDHS